MRGMTPLEVIPLIYTTTLYINYTPILKDLKQYSYAQVLLDNNDSSVYNGTKVENIIKC